MPPPPFCSHCKQPVYDDPDHPRLVHARSGNAMCADGKHVAELAD